MARPLIIVADPNEMTRDLLRQLFEEDLDALVAPLSNASDLGPMLHESIPDLVVVEIGTDRLADVAVVAKTRRDNPRVPFMVLTAWDLPTDPVDLERTTGANVVISKPFRLEDVREAALRMVAEASGQAPSPDFAARTR